MVSGSSPLTRGKHLHASIENQRKRLIPAHAGKTGDHDPLHEATRAHPRSRGENAPGRASPPGCGGSSPLTRGKHVGLINKSREVRLIPAHAGKTFGAGDLARDKRAHPRSRGENSSRR